MRGWGLARSVWPVLTPNPQTLFHIISAIEYSILFEISYIKPTIMANDAVQIGDTFIARDSSCKFIVTKFTRVGYNGIIVDTTGREAEGSVTYSQLESDFVLCE